MRNGIRQLLDYVDAASARLSLAARREPPRIVALTFHQVLRDADWSDHVSWIRPGYAVRLSTLRRIVERFLESGYRFIDISDLASPNLDGTHAVLLTFDDGYFNNTLVGPLLDELELPATFFVAPHFVHTGESFWWDALFREGGKWGKRSSDLVHQEGMMQRWPFERIRTYLMEEFGRDVLEPRGEVDRPFTEEELSDFARSEWVTIGNHTLHHQMLEGVDEQVAVSEIEEGAAMLEMICGERPHALAFPEGRAAPQFEDALHRLGVSWAFSSRSAPIPQRLEQRQEIRYLLGRYGMREASWIEGQVARIRHGRGVRAALRRRGL